MQGGTSRSVVRNSGQSIESESTIEGIDLSRKESYYGSIMVQPKCTSQAIYPTQNNLIKFVLLETPRFFVLLLNLSTIQIISIAFGECSTRATNSFQSILYQCNQFRAQRSGRRFVTRRV